MTGLDITPTPFGARVDVTEQAYLLLDDLAKAFAHNEDNLGDLLFKLNEARESVVQLTADGAHEHNIEAAALQVDELRAEIVGALDPADRIVIPLTEHGCEAAGAALTAAAEQTFAAKVREAPYRLTAAPERRAA